mmetsp:Transcript_26409/g.23336  ORF Transcript_26409/g.23336 Transcript_26409/m.23336 type:complete len:158 (+) Transcript_26409:1398-1871(+)
MKESYENLINELTTEIKQIYDNTNKELQNRDAQITALEQEREDSRREFTTKIEVLKNEISALEDANRSTRRALDETKKDILTLNSQLDDQKRLVRTLETENQLLKAEKSSSRSDFSKGSHFGTIRDLNRSEVKTNFNESRYQPYHSPTSSFGMSRKF